MLQKRICLFDEMGYTNLKRWNELRELFLRLALFEGYFLFVLFLVLLCLTVFISVVNQNR